MAGEDEGARREFAEELGMGGWAEELANGSAACLKLTPCLRWGLQCLACTIMVNENYKTMVQCL